MTYMMASQLSDSVLDDDAVDDAVRVATECLSTTSSTSNEVSIATEAAEDSEQVGHQPRAAEDEEGDFFVIRRPQVSQGWGEKWSAFESDHQGA